MEHPGYIRVGAEDGFHMGIEEGTTADVGAVGIEMVIQVDDVDRRYQEMKAKGAGFVDPPADQPWGARQAWLTDPDGYRLSIFTPLAPAQP